MIVFGPGTLVFIDGQRVSEADAKVSVFDRGLLYGDSVFETIRTHRGRPFMLAEHIGRLRRSAELVYIDLALTDAELRTQIESAIAESHNEDCYVRVTLTRGVGELGLDPSQSGGPCLIIIVTPLHRPSAEAYENGVAAVTYKTQRAAESTEASGAKIGNYLVAVLAMRVAKAQHANEALILNREERVVEGATSNLFYRQGDQLLTPPLSDGILAGITRQLVLEVAEREKLAVHYRSPGLGELLQADEVFITSSIREMLAIVSIDGHSVADGRPGKMYRQLWTSFQSLVLERLESDR